jgi:hypothetical protein
MPPETKTTNTARKTAKMTKTDRTTPKANGIPEGLKDVPDEETKKKVGAMDKNQAVTLEEDMANNKKIPSDSEAKTRYTDEEKNALLEEAIRNGALDRARAILDEEKKERGAVKAILEEKKVGETEEL